jgi:hypothetical protein
MAGKTSRYGVHRFSSTTGNHDSDTAQIVSASMVQYIREMEVDTALFDAMTLVGKNEIKIL